MTAVTHAAPMKIFKTHIDYGITDPDLVTIAAPPKDIVDNLVEGLEEGALDFSVIVPVVTGVLDSVMFGGVLIFREGELVVVTTTTASEINVEVGIGSQRPLVYETSGTSLSC
jgi:hypothetical protein